MKPISLHELPLDYFYYRSYTSAFGGFYREKSPKNIILVEEDGNYGYIKHYLFWWFSIGVFEKSDINPTPELLKKYGMKRGLVFWSPWHYPPKKKTGWLSLGYLISHEFHHSIHSAFSVLDCKDYQQKWSSNARNHRKRIQKYLDQWEITIQSDTSWEDFLSAYSATPLPHRYKNYFIWRQKYFQERFPEKFRIITASVWGKILAGAIFLDDHPTSTYLIAFQHSDAKKYHLGLAVLDAWYGDSYNKWYKYLDLDHMYSFLDTRSYLGYTRFKSELADYDVRFPAVYMKLFLK